MADVGDLIGQILDPASAPPVPAGAPLVCPASKSPLATGIKVLDALAPWPRGGRADFLGPEGTGHLAILREITHNLLGHGPAALVAVTATDTPGPGPWPDEHNRLVRLVEIKPEVPALAVAAPHRQAQSALDYGSRCASTLAATGAQVLLAVDPIIVATVGATLFTGRVGLTTHDGSVTGIRVAPHPVRAEPTPAWDTADAVTITNLGDLRAGRYPAIDPIASHSAVAATDAEHRRVAAECRRTLAVAAELRDYLVQNFWVAEEHTGTPGETSTPDQTITGLAELIDH